MELRDWQQRFVKEWDRRKRDSSFLLVAIPGSGKTFASLSVIHNWRAAGPDRRVIIVVPTDNLKMQWRDEATAFGLHLQTKEFGTNFKEGFQGCVTTYHSVARQPLLYRKLCSVAPTIVVFDEIHHCGDEASFGKGVKEAFEGSRERLLLSGTPWKTDGASIPFIRYDGSGFPITDFRYDYPNALNDEVVRYLMFKHSGGEIIFNDSNRVEEVNENITDEDASKRLRKLLSPTGEFVRQQIKEAHRKLSECRKIIPDAAALVACIDKSHAEKVAGTIKKVTGCQPSVIVSDGELANDTVKAFRNKSTEWLVAVRQVTEGTDIKRLQVLCYFTNYATEVFFRQIIGRISRVRGLDDFEGYVYLPADPRLIRYSKNIENAQVQALKDQANQDGSEFDKTEMPNTFPELYSTQHTGQDVMLIGNHQFSKADAELIERAAEAAGVSMEKMATGFEVFQNGPIAHVAPVPKTEIALEETTDKLRRDCNRLAFRLSKMKDVEPKDVHGKFAPQGTMTESQLQAKQRQLKAWIVELG